MMNNDVSLSLSPSSTHHHPPPPATLLPVMNFQAASPTANELKYARNMQTREPGLSRDVRICHHPSEISISNPIKTAPFQHFWLFPLHPTSPASFTPPSSDISISSSGSISFKSPEMAAPVSPAAVALRVTRRNGSQRQRSWVAFDHVANRWRGHLRSIPPAAPLYSRPPARSVAPDAHFFPALFKLT